MDLDFEFEQARRFSGENKNAGRIVETKDGVLGRIYNNEALINGKYRVHCIDGKKLLCSPENLKLKGFVD